MTVNENADIKATILDSGNRRQFSSGAVRDIAEGKGRMDLLPLDIISNIELYYSTHYAQDERKYPFYPFPSILSEISNFMQTGDESCIYKACCWFIRDRYGKENSAFYTAILELAIHYEQGANKYQERNWEKGIDCHCYIDSGLRHLFKYSRGDQDEHHDRAFLWNMAGLLWTVKHKPQFNDLIYNQKGANDEKCEDTAR